MSKSFVPSSYKSVLGIYDTQNAIELTKRTFESKITSSLNLKRISAPLFVDASSGLNDDLNGVERPVSFDILETQTNAQIVHSLAKWKRLALYKYGFKSGEGLYTNMNAIRRDEEMDNIHSIYVDQWDWEKVITRDERTTEYLHSTVTTIYNAVKNLGDYVNRLYRDVRTEIPNEIYFITSQELEDLYPDKTPKEREDLVTKAYGAVFIEKIGGPLRSGKPHDGRSPDYDDWELNGDILLWNEILNSSFEITSMGIRVDAESMDRQLRLAGAEDRRPLPYHQAVLHDELPLTIGGGIGQSRLCMFFLRKAHIGEVQVSVWPEEMDKTCREHNIFLL